MGGVYRNKIRIYGHCWGATEKIITRALERQQKGFTAIKILLEPFTANRGVKRYIDGQIARFAQIRKPSVTRWTLQLISMAGSTLTWRYKSSMG